MVAGPADLLPPHVWYGMVWLLDNWSPTSSGMVWYGMVWLLDRWSPTSSCMVLYGMVAGQLVSYILRYVMVWYVCWTYGLLHPQVWCGMVWLLDIWSPTSSGQTLSCRTAWQPTEPPWTWGKGKQICKQSPSGSNHGLEVLRKPWESPEKVLRNQWESNKKVIRNSWESPEKIPEKSPEKVLRKSWESPEKVPGNSCKSAEKILRKSWESPATFYSTQVSSTFVLVSSVRRQWISHQGGTKTMTLLERQRPE